MKVGIVIKKIFGFLIILITALLLAVNQNIMAEMPKQDASAQGKVYDGVDFNSLIGNRVYFGSYKHLTESKSSEFYGALTKSREEYPTPLQWQVMGEDGDQNGNNKDNLLTLFSDYVIDTKRFSGFGKASFAGDCDLLSGEADYKASYVGNWLNKLGVYSYELKSSPVIGNPARYCYQKFDDEPGFANNFQIESGSSNLGSGDIYNAELNALGRKNVDTYFIAQGKGWDTGVVIRNTGDITKYNGSSSTEGEWNSYYGAGVYGFNGWPVTMNDAYAYLPMGVYSMTGKIEHNKLFWNADGLPPKMNYSGDSVEYSTGSAGNEYNRGMSKYDEEVFYWTRSPEGWYNNSSSVYNYVVMEYSTPGRIDVRPYTLSRDSAGVRPITKLNPNNVMMTHEIVNSKPTLSNQIKEDKSTTTTNWNYSQSDDYKSYKLTLVSDKVSLNSLTDSDDKEIDLSAGLKVEQGKTITVKSDDYVGDYLAYKIVQVADNGDRTIVAYGTSKGSTPDDLVINPIKSTIDNSSLAEGNYVIYIWAQGEDEQGLDSSSVHSFEGSSPKTLVLTVTPEVLEYYVTYDGNGETSGTAPVDSNNPYYKESMVTVLEKGDLEKTGHTFVGWNTKEDGTGTTYVPNTTDNKFKIIADTILYAKWKANDYNITYELYGGANDSSNPNKYTYGVGVTSFANPSKTGHTFKGWFAESSYTNTFTSISTTDIGDKVLHAKWEANNYNVTYDLDGGTNDPSNPNKYTYGVGVPSFADPSKTGHTFKGWFAESSHTNEFTSISTTDTGDKKLYAKWEVNKYNITYNLYGGTNNTNNPNEYTYGVGVASFDDASREGYTFDGWYTDDTYTSAFTSISTTDTGDKTLYAKWIANDNVYKVEHYTETLLVNKYQLHQSQMHNAKTGSKATYTIKDIVGYVFNESKKTYEDSKSPASKKELVVAGDGSLIIKLYYDREVYKVKYDGNGHTKGKVPSSHTIRYGESIIVKEATMKKEKHDFVEWKINPIFNPGDTLTLDDYMIKFADENNVITLVAQWKKAKALPDGGRNIFPFFNF
ncbi:putative repeat protein (TIGR02543 family) [Bacilli bacterium PM5-3]|nr:putative repeat protein (TIGR02543 family) [Bacilli bacterium PM5-3]